MALSYKMVLGWTAAAGGLTQQMQLDSSVTASMDTTTNPGVVTTWTDQVGPPYTFVQSFAKPTYPGTTQNGKTTCRFDLSNGTSMKCTAVTATAPLVVFSVVGLVTIPTGSNVFYFHDDTQGTSRVALFLDGSTGKWNIFAGTATATGSSTATTGWVATAFYLDGSGNGTLYINQGVTAEIPSSAIGSGAFVNGNGMNLGGRYNNANASFIDANIGEIRIYTGTPAGLGTPGGDIGTIISSLRTKWGF
jgi:hypothetical protein